MMTLKYVKFARKEETSDSRQVDFVLIWEFVLLGGVCGLRVWLRAPFGLRFLF